MDQEKFGSLARLSKNIESLNDLCTQFKDTITTGKSDFSPVGNITIKNGVVAADIFGYTIRSVERIILSESNVAFIELSFVAGEEQSLNSCYLSTGGTVFTEPNFDNKLCEFNNTYASEHVFMFIAEALIKSKLFEPNHTRNQD